MKIPKPLINLIEDFQKLPGIGPKTAQRLTYYLLHVPQSQLDSFANSLSLLKKNTILCSICKNVSETDPCLVCADGGRDKTVLMVVEQPLDILAFEKTNKFKGIYHVLHGKISPLENIGPDEIFVSDLINRVKKDNNLKEVIVATNPTMEGEATAMYIVKKIQEARTNGKKIMVTRLGMGVPTGAELEYADELTLSQALEGRKSIN